MVRIVGFFFICPLIEPEPRLPWTWRTLREANQLIQIRSRSRGGVRKFNEVLNSSFASLLADQFVRVAVVSPELRVADVAFNTSRIAAAIRALNADGVRLAVFPELAVTGYTCADLFYQPTLRTAAEQALTDIAAITRETGMLVVIGVPLEILGRLYNCAAVFDDNGLAGIVPKSVLPSAVEFYEERWFSRGETLPVLEISIGGELIPCGTDLIFQSAEWPALRLAVEICEDLWSPRPPSTVLALAGATVIANPSASDEVLGKAPYRRALVEQQSARCHAAYIYSAAGPGESSTDLVYSGHGLIAENGHLLAETRRFEFSTTWAISEIDLGFLTAERLRNSGFSAGDSGEPMRIVSVTSGETAPSPLTRRFARRPFVPEDDAARDAHCREVFAIQSTGLAARLRHIGSARPVLGISGGLDSTLALLVCLAAMEKLGRPHADIIAVGMPGPGSTSGTQSNAAALASALGVTFREIPIGDAVASHLRDIAHPENTFDVTFENAQARERTQILMDVANQVGGIVVGTGDLSESALGWCTFNGDHMSMYHVNASVPKTLVRYVVEWAASKPEFSDVAETLRAVCATPITPELLPLGAGGELAQRTEDTLGSYDLHDFFLYHTIRRASRPETTFALACAAFDGDFSPRQILDTLKTFYRRFFASQFKRSSMPDGPKVGTVALSPRGDWRMPSDASAALWLDACERISRHLEA